jgi:hypothetical protein
LTDISVQECSITSTSALTDSEGQGEKRKRGRPKKFAAAPFLDGVEQRQDSQIAPKRGRGRPRQMRCAGGQFGTQSAGAEHPEFEVELDDPVQPPAEPVRVADAREGN